ncbi:MAG: geranylgeranylglyceryl/heptaprenylglyceryl phosphate synthase [Bacteroidia bacterium]|nr:geranylgeranylglyceryl/heptaprenylglyceryl phosphate synthase [Bacteroidia bacterium]MBP9689093.1 geranylgeranylglyceryl/heptaprenylglyceryl phosphate synthase [Bacteroidia bacterium]
MKNNVLHTLKNHIVKNQKHLAVLIDPDSLENEKQLIDICEKSNQANVDFILVGGSLITNGFFEKSIQIIKANSHIPVILFPGNIMQVSVDADAILLLSLISGRNPDLLIGKHVLAAPMLKQSGLEIIPTGYMLIDGGNITSVSYMSNTTPIPAEKHSIAACTAMAGEMLGLQVTYMDAGSGAQNPISSKIISAVRESVTGPIFVGGGIKTAEGAIAACKAGADVVVVGNAFEKEPELIHKIAQAVHGLHTLPA